MKILIAADTYYPHVNGAAYFARRLACYLHNRSHEVRVIAPSGCLCNEVFEQDGVMVTGIRSIPVFIYKNFRISPRVMQGKSIRHAMVAWQPDIVHVQSHFFICKEVLKMAYEMEIPTIVTNHFMPENLVHYFPFPVMIKEWLKKWGWKQLATVFKTVDVITTPTKTAAQLLSNIGLKKEVHAVSCGIDLKRFNPGRKDLHLKLKYNIPKGKKIILYVGRLDKEKNIALVLKGFSQISEEFNLHFVIAGMGAEEGTLKKLVKKSGQHSRVTFTGFVPDDELPGLYALSHCFIIAGIAELQSIVTMEAMASGLPVVAVRAMALPELVHSSVNGYLFEPGDEAGIQNGIETIFSCRETRKKMGEKSLEIIENHDINKTIHKFELIYQNLLCS
ncbi:glycosyltransferase [Desulfobacula sp.]